MEKELRFIGMTALGYVAGVFLFRIISRFAPGVAAIGTAPMPQPGPAKRAKGNNPVTGA